MWWILMSSKLKSKVHVQPYEGKNGFGTLCEWVELNSYDVEDEHSLALITVHGFDADSEERSVDLWVTAKQVKAIRDGLNQLLEEES